MIAFADPVRNPNQIANDLIGRSYLSWSGISAYLRCPLKFQFRYLEQLPEEFVSSNLIFGSAIHAGLENYFRSHLEGRQLPDLASLMTVYRETWSQTNLAEVQFGKSEDLAVLEQTAGRMFQAFLESDLTSPGGTIVGIEEEFQAPVISGCPDLFARLDLIVETNDGLAITDFKTSRGRWSTSETLANEGQLLIYHELARQWIDKPIRLQFAVITKTKQPDVEVRSVVPDPIRIERIRALIKKAWAGIQSGNFYPVPNAMHCPTCGYRDRCSQWVG